MSSMNHNTLLGNQPSIVTKGTADPGISVK